MRSAAETEKENWRHIDSKKDAPNIEMKSVGKGRSLSPKMEGIVFGNSPDFGISSPLTSSLSWSKLAPERLVRFADGDR